MQRLSAAHCGHTPLVWQRRRTIRWEDICTRWLRALIDAYVVWAVHP